MFNVNFDVELKRKGLNIHLAVYKILNYRQRRVAFVGFFLQSGWLHLKSWKDKLEIGITDRIFTPQRCTS